MEHLPQPRNSVLDPIEVPYVVIEDIHAYNVDHLTFSQFRQAHGFDEQTMRKNGWNAYARSNPEGGQIESSRVVESFLQEWLFFGLLYEVLREDFRREDYLIKREGRPLTITTSKLPDTLWSYKQRWASMSHDTPAQNQQRMHTRACLGEASEFVNKFLGSQISYTPAVPLREDVILSIAIMVSTLSAAAAQVCKIPKFVTTRPQMVDTLLLNHHWCPTSLAMLERRAFGPQGMYYAALLGPLPSNRLHSSCSKRHFGCNANNVVGSEYKTRHSPDCKVKEHDVKSDCPFEHLDHGEVCRIVELDDVYPVAVVLGESYSTFSLEVHDSSFVEPYVAISHVWGDGLGNEKGNALPRCQLQRLQRLVNSTYGAARTESVPFWIDTLCCPTEPRASRDRAIGKMAGTYRRADRILVLDANLFMNSLASCQADSTEILMRISSTNWMRRLWTLLEGVVGKSYYFAFFDGVVDIQEHISALRMDLLKAHQSISPPEDRRLLLNMYPGQDTSRTALEQYTRMRDPMARQENMGLPAMWNTMQWRSTSWTSDETICMAHILGFTPSELGELQDVDVIRIRSPADDEEKASLEALQRTQLAARYKLFLQLLIRHQTRIPRGFLFTRADRFDEPGFRWAPSSFFRTAATGTIVAAEPAGLVSAAGLHINAHAFELHLPPAPFNARFIMVDEATEDFYDVDYAEPTLPNTVPWKDLAPEGIQDPAIVLADYSRDPQIGSMGVLVAVTKRTEQTIFATYLGRVWLRKFPAAFMNWDVLSKSKGAAHAAEIKGGLMSRLWNRRPGVQRSSDPPSAASPDVLDTMPERWRQDGAALNDELDHMFASGRLMSPGKEWCIG